MEKFDPNYFRRILSKKITLSFNMLSSSPPKDYWNHRILATEQNGEMYFEVHEVHYRDGKPAGYATPAVTLGAEDIEGLKWTLEKMQGCLSKPILWAGERFPEAYEICGICNKEPLQNGTCIKCTKALWFTFKRTNCIMEKFELKRTIQCANCPWKVGADPYSIKNYSVVLHRELECTIAKGFNIGQGTLPVMACHHSKDDHEEHCVGWLWNQLGPGNNIALRMQMLGCTNSQDIQVVGEQHERFEDTLPEKWVDFEEDCPHCGAGVEVFTKGKEIDGIQYVFDGDPVRCAAQCGYESGMTVDEDGAAFVQYGNQDELDDDFECCVHCDQPDACSDFGCAIESGVREDDFTF